MTLAMMRPTRKAKEEQEQEQEQEQEEQVAVDVSMRCGGEVDSSSTVVSLVMVDRTYRHCVPPAGGTKFRLLHQSQPIVGAVCLQRRRSRLQRI